MSLSARLGRVTARQTGAGSGLQTAALYFAGKTAPTTRVANTEQYDGTSWTEVNDVNTARQQLGGSGTQTSSLAYGGFIPPDSAATELWNGTNWTELRS